MGSKAEHQVTLIVVRMADGGVASGVACCIVAATLTACAHSLLIREGGNLVRGS